MSRLLSGASDLLIRSSFSQEYETEADEEGWRVLVAARIDPRGMRESFEKLQSYEIARKYSVEMPQAFASHPALSKRIARLEMKWRELADKNKFEDVSRFNRHLRAASGDGG